MSRADEVRELAARCGAPVELALRADGLGLLPHEPDAAARRLRLLAFAHARGVDEDLLLDAVREYGDLLVAFDDLASPPADVDLDGAAARVGLGTAAAHEIAEAIGGLSSPTVDDVAALDLAARALRVGLPLDVLLQLLRVFADGMDRLADAENRIFHDSIHEEFRAQGLTGRDLMEATAGIGNGLLEMLEPTVLYFHRKAYARAAQHDFLRHLTEQSRPVPTVRGAASCAVVFADLSGFTALTAAAGDVAAAEVLVRFGAAVRRLVAAHDGRVVKQIGDAFMMVFDQPRDAVLCGVGLLDWCAGEPRFPPVHVGAHAGEVLFREGDLVGGVVNLAARVASVTAPMQLLVTDDVLAGLDLGDLAVSAQGEHALKGMEQPVLLHAVRRP